MPGFLQACTASVLLTAAAGLHLPGSQPNEYGEDCKRMCQQAHFTLLAALLACDRGQVDDRGAEQETAAELLAAVCCTLCRSTEGCLLLEQRWWPSLF